MPYPKDFPRCYKPWLSGRIGAVEHRVCNELIAARHNHTDPLTTGDLVKAVYLGPYGRKSRWDAPPPKLAHWMYHRIRKACEVYAVRVGRGEGHGSPVCA